MGYYHCPRCGGNESYVGNTLVNRNGVTLTQEIGNSGVYGSASSGGTEAVQVRKCRGCGEILTSANFVKSSEELEREKEEAERKRVEKAVEEKKFPAFSAVGLLALPSFVLWAVSYSPSPMRSVDEMQFFIFAAVVGGGFAFLWFLGGIICLRDWKKANASSKQ